MINEDPFDWDAFIFDTNELSLAAVGGWLKCLHKMRKSVTRGRISMPIEGYARMFGSSVDQAKRVVEEIAEFRVGDAETENGKITLTNRRMYRKTNLSPKSSEIKKLPKVSETSPNSTYISSSSLEQKDVKKEERQKQICRVFGYWQSILNHPQAKLTIERRRFINARLEEGYTVDELKKAIEGCKRSPHHMGRNDHGKIYDSIDLIFRNGSKVEQFMGYLRSAPQAKAFDPGRSLDRCPRCNDAEQVFEGNAIVPCPECQTVSV